MTRILKRLDEDGIYHWHIGRRRQILLRLLLWHGRVSISLNRCLISQIHDNRNNTNSSRNRTIDANQIASIDSDSRRGNWEEGNPVSNFLWIIPPTWLSRMRIWIYMELYWDIFFFFFFLKKPRSKILSLKYEKFISSE